MAWGEAEEEQAAPTQSRQARDHPGGDPMDNRGFGGARIGVGGRHSLP